MPVTCDENAQKQPIAFMFYILSKHIFIFIYTQQQQQQQRKYIKRIFFILQKSKQRNTSKNQIRSKKNYMLKTRVSALRYGLGLHNFAFYEI